MLLEGQRSDLLFYEPPPGKCQRFPSVYNDGSIAPSAVLKRTVHASRSSSDCHKDLLSVDFISIKPFRIYSSSLFGKTSAHAHAEHA